MTPIGLLGGTFDPIHLGHLRAALEICQAIPLQEVRFIPCQQPVHKSPTLATVEQRLTMLRLGIEGYPLFKIDECELHRETPSYMIETLESMRAEDAKTPFCLIMGMDALVDFCRWKRWEDILNLTHLVVAYRADHPLPRSGQIAAVLKKRLCTDSYELSQERGGKIFLQTTTILDISSSQIRQDIAAGIDPRYLLPEAVWDYIQQEKLYT